jgi:hypothetical protein
MLHDYGEFNIVVDHILTSMEQEIKSLMKSSRWIKRVTNTSR